MDGNDDLDDDGDDDEDDDMIDDVVPRGPGGSVQGGLNILQQQRQIEAQRRQFITGGADWQNKLPDWMMETCVLKSHLYLKHDNVDGYKDAIKLIFNLCQQTLYSTAVGQIYSSQRKPNYIEFSRIISGCLLEISVWKRTCSNAMKILLRLHARL